ncbi:hypothetical protein SBOR_2202 [Sclerotinia borealis F-4128]|uniref:Protein kinase domain-containing protein n=1 Tax=Sclerotinia borealis (strain F-4128) TaxID=1432307 RepID=W9CS70_SCLBF|nr:hypothetical protein SBOR_2202 [Sclerotinia borealis F-4128]
MYELSNDAIEIIYYQSEGVKEFLAIGGICFIGLVDQNIVLKYARIKDDKFAKESFDREAQVFEIIGSHLWIIGFKGRQGESILMERATGGSLGEYLSEYETTIQQRFHWVYQFCEAVEHIYDKGVIHCDLKANNALLDDDLNVKLCDF